MFQINNTDTLKSASFAYFHSIINYGIIWGGGRICLTAKRYNLQMKTAELKAGVKS
jgi:hypothetical protein